MRRAGLARFTTLACALGLVLSGVTGARPTLALVGLMAALTSAIGGLALSHVWPPRRSLPPGPCRSRSRLQAAPGLTVLSVVLVGLFIGYLGGSVRVEAMKRSTLESRIGSRVSAELVITGQVRSNGGWQSATAVVAGLSPLAPAGDPAIGETVLLEVAPDEKSVDGAASRGAPGASLSQGMIVAFKGNIEAPEGPSDSGYDQARQLLHQGIEVVLRADGAASIAVVGRRGGIAGWFDSVRASARDHLSLGPNARVNEVLQGVVVGDTIGIDDGWLTAFRRSGTAHMLSVSGLHVASLAAIMIGLARLLGAARWVGFLLAGISALLMVPFVGASPPIIRSAVMICIVLVGSWVGRGRDQWQILGLAAIVVLALNPFSVFDVGFQLSFAAFVGMLTLLGPLQKVLGHMPPAIASNVAVSVAASAGTAPVALAVFDKTSLVSPLANLLVVPTLPLVTGLGMASVFLGFVWTGFSVVLDALASLPMTWTVLVSRLCAVAPVLDAADLGRVLSGVAMGAVLAPAALALLGRPVRTPFNLPLPLFGRSVAWLRVHRPRSRRRAAVLGAALVLMGLAVGGVAYPSLVRGLETVETLVAGKGWPDEVEVRVLDVGQGNAVLVRTPEHHALLFDGGPADCDLTGQLRALGVQRLDLVVISHPHADHFAGLLQALDGLEVEMLVDGVQVVSGADGMAARAGPAAASASPAGAASAAAGAAPDDAGEAADYLDLRRWLAEDGCRYWLAATGDMITVDGVLVRLFAPSRPLVLIDGAEPWAVLGGEPSGDELNGASVVAVLSVGSIDVLIPGDAEADVLERYELPPTELLVVSHHGSQGAVSRRLLEEWGTRAAVVSVGEANSFGHPYAGTMSALEGVVGTVLRTDTDGWVCCRVHGDTMAITRERTPTR